MSGLQCVAMRSPRAVGCERALVGRTCDASVPSTPRSLHTVPRPFSFHSAQRVKDGRVAAGAAQLLASAATVGRAAALRGFRAGSLTPQSLSLSARCLSGASAAAGSSALCRRLEEEFTNEQALAADTTQQPAAHCRPATLQVNADTRRQPLRQGPRMLDTICGRVRLTRPVCARVCVLCSASWVGEMRLRDSRYWEERARRTALSTNKP